MVQRQMRRAIVTGGTGYIGSILTDMLRRGARLDEVWSFGSGDLDVRDRAAVARAMNEFHPDAVFHCAARADTDWCEQHYDDARAVNVDGSVNLVEEALDAGARVVYFSSACLYPDNLRYHREGDPLAALCRYTETKLQAERALEPHFGRILSIRMRQPFSNNRHPRNLLQKLAGYTQFIDEPNSMSHLEECLPVVWQLCREGASGAFNIVNECWTTPLRIAHMLRTHHRPSMEISRISHEQLLQMVSAPRVNSLVDCPRLRQRGILLNRVEDAVRDCLENPCQLGEYHWGRALR